MRSKSEDTRFIEAIGNINAIVPAELVIRIGELLRDMNEERVHGGLDINFNMTDGIVRSADMNRRSHWRPVASKPPKAADELS